MTIIKNNKDWFIQFFFNGKSIEVFQRFQGIKYIHVFREKRIIHNVYGSQEIMNINYPVLITRMSVFLWHKFAAFSCPIGNSLAPDADERRISVTDHNSNEQRNTEY